jgi:hypothetical protein
MIKKIHSSKQKMKTISMVCRSMEQRKFKATNWKSQRFGNSSHLTSFSNSTSSSFDKFDYALHGPTRSKGLEHPTLGTTCQFLFTKIIWSRWLVCKQHLQSAVRIPTMQKIRFVSIWFVGIPRICQANIPTTRYLCS